MGIDSYSANNTAVGMVLSSMQHQIDELNKESVMLREVITEAEAENEKLRAFIGLFKCKCAVGDDGDD